LKNIFVLVSYFTEWYTADTHNTDGMLQTLITLNGTLQTLITLNVTVAYQAHVGIAGLLASCYKIFLMHAM